jgi:hypothetical protein
MTAHHPAGLSSNLIAHAFDALGQARSLLLQPAPRNLDMASSALAIAAERITELQTALNASPTRDLAAAVAGLHREVGTISQLLEHAASYHVNLMQCMIKASEAPSGPSPEPARRLSLEA